MKILVMDKGTKDIFMRYRTDHCEEGDSLKIKYIYKTCRADDYDNISNVS
jgi:hypothetical protein